MRTGSTTSRSRTFCRCPPSDGYEAVSSVFFIGEYLTTSHVTLAASAITHAMKMTIPSNPRTSSTADLE